MIASIITINIAFDTADGLVTDDYYKEGLGIHKNADSSATAQRLGIAGALDYDADTGAVTIRFDKPLPADSGPLTLSLSHPTLPDQDQTTRLTPLDASAQTGRIEPLGPANWKVMIHPDEKSWRIDGRLAIPGGGARID
ncbi:MAG: FixH family protein [Gammaproteobacteria bacterium]|nr:FixH family protein [Gammaproteobacteria bacterium]